jgi:hypothetical protein
MTFLCQWARKNGPDAKQCEVQCASCRTWSQPKEAEDAKQDPAE